jgi:hypothetical protein
MLSYQIKYLLIIVFVFISAGAMGAVNNGVEVTPEGNYTKEQMRHDNIFYNERAPREKELRQKLEQLNRLLNKRKGMSANPDEYIKATKSALDFITKNSLLSRAITIDNLSKSINMRAEEQDRIQSKIDFFNMQIADAYKIKDRKLNKAKQNKAKARKALDEEKKLKATETKEAKHQRDFWAGSQTKKGGVSNSDDDFWSSSSSSKKTKTNSQSSKLKSESNDFWATQDSPTNQTVEEPNFEIKSRANTQGVVSNTGEILIPFRNWDIISFRDGMAKVWVQDDFYNNRCANGKMNYKGDNYDGYYYTIYTGNEGIVDQRGDWIIGPDKYVRGSYDSSSFFGLYVINRDWSASDERASKARKKRKKLECKMKIRQEYQELLAKLRNG